MLAAGAKAVEFEAMSFNDEAVPGRDFFLESFNVAVFKLHDLPAFRADQMIVVALVRDVVVLGLRPEVSSLRQACLTEEVERPVNGRQAQVRIFACELVVQFFRRDVLLLEERIQDQFTLAGVLELVFPQMLFQQRHFFLMFGHMPAPSRQPRRAPLKTKTGVGSRASDEGNGHERPV